MKLAGFLNLDNFAPLIVPALGAGAVRHFLFVAVGTLGKAVAFESVVGAPGRGALLRVSPFWIRHGSKFLSRGLRASRKNQLKAVRSQP